MLLLAVALTTSSSASGTGTAAIRVDRPDALWDQPITITLSGMPPRARVALHASAPAEDGTMYASSTSLRADADGQVVLDGNRAMRVLWSMHPAHTDTYLYIPPGTTKTIALTANVRGQVLARATVRRHLLAAGVRMRVLRPGEDGVYGELYLPPRTNARQPAVLLFGGSSGGLGRTREARLLASHGYPALALAYFDEPGLPENLLRIPLEYFARALHVLARQPGVDPSKLVVDGSSRGSEAAQLLGVHYPKLVHAVVALVPSNGAVCGIEPWTGRNHLTCLGPAWTIRGKAIPYSDFGSSHTTTPIPDERIAGPVFLTCGGFDMLWPSCPMAEAIVDRLRANHFTHRVTLLEYPRAGHGVGSLVPYGPARSRDLDGVSNDALQRARADGWRRYLAFLAGL